MVKVLGRTQSWLHYRLPKRFIRPSEDPVCIGQKQVWFLLRLTGAENDIRLDADDTPEFDHWRWVTYWYPISAVVDFKQAVYRQALTQLAGRLNPQRKPPRRRRGGR
jgi:putative (di)nucleoside polyphosphate hydrolase